MTLNYQVVNTRSSASRDLLRIDEGVTAPFRSITLTTHVLVHTVRLIRSSNNVIPARHIHNTKPTIQTQETGVFSQFLFPLENGHPELPATYHLGFFSFGRLRLPCG